MEKIGSANSILELDEKQHICYTCQSCVTQYLESIYSLPSPTRYNTTMFSPFYSQHHMQLLEERLAQFRAQKQNIVLVTGVFDLLHQEHKTFLQKAKAIGDILIVGVETDMRVRKMKGEGRPVQNEQTRLSVIQKLPYVDEVFILPEAFSSPQDHEELISFIKPHILAVSSHSDHQDKKRALVEKHGGSLQIVHEHNPNISTTKILSSVVQ